MPGSHIFNGSLFVTPTGNRDDANILVDSISNTITMRNNQGTNLIIHGNPSVADSIITVPDIDTVIVSDPIGLLAYDTLGRIGSFPISQTPSIIGASTGGEIVSYALGEGLIVDNGAISVDPSIEFDILSVDELQVHDSIVVDDPSQPGVTRIGNGILRLLNDPSQAIILDSISNTPGVTIYDVTSGGASRQWSIVTAPTSSDVTLSIRYGSTATPIIDILNPANNQGTALRIPSITATTATPQGIVAYTSDGSLSRLIIGSGLSVSGNVLSAGGNLVTPTMTQGYNIESQITAITDPSTDQYTRVIDTVNTIQSGNVAFTFTARPNRGYLLRVRIIGRFTNTYGFFEKSYSVISSAGSVNIGEINTQFQTGFSMNTASTGLIASFSVTQEGRYIGIIEVLSI